MAVIPSVALTNTFDTWRTRSNDAFARLNAFAIDETSLYASTLTANTSFRAKGTSVLQGGVTMNRSLIVNNNITVSGNTTISGILNVNGGINLGDATTDLLTITGRASVGTNLTVSGNTTIGAAGKVANVTGWFGVTGRATVSTNLFVAGNTTIGGALNIKGAINLGDATTDLLTITGRASVGTNLSIGGNTSITRHLTVTGNTNVGKLVAGNVATYSLSTIGPLTAEGRASISTNLQVFGNTTLGASGKVANVTGWFGVTGRQSISTNLFVGGNTTLNGTTTDKSNALSQTLTDASTIAWDTNSGRVATVTLGASRTFGAPTNLKVGTYILSIIQGGSGSYGITWNGVFKWTAGVAPVLTTTVGARDLFTFYSDGTNLYGSYLPDVK
jgi:hypothetical protein